MPSIANVLSGNLSRLLAQPIYRDNVINGKFLAGLVMLAILIISIVMLVAGLGLRMIGVPPEAEEILRLFMFMVVSVLYGAFWMSLAILFSTLFRRPPRRLLASIAIWIFLFLFMSLIARSDRECCDQPVTQNSTVDEVARFDTIFRMISRISPGTLYTESIQAILLPVLGTSSPTMMMIGMYSGLKPAPLPLKPEPADSLAPDGWLAGSHGNLLCNCLYQVHA